MYDLERLQLHLKDKCMFSIILLSLPADSLAHSSPMWLSMREGKEYHVTVERDARHKCLFRKTDGGPVSKVKKDI